MVPVKKEKILLDPAELKFVNRPVFNPACIEVDGNIPCFTGQPVQEIILL